VTTILPLIDYLIITPLCAINNTQSSWGYNLNFTNNLTPKNDDSKNYDNRGGCKLCRKGMIPEAQQELFADDVTIRDQEKSKEHIITALSLAKSAADKQKIKIKLDAL
jgi:hypothetical protein